MREALKYLRDASREFCHLILNSKYNRVMDKYKYAEVARIRDSIANAGVILSAPARNCDVGTVKEQTDRYTKFCGSHKNTHGNCISCPREGDILKTERGKKFKVIYDGVYMKAERMSQ